jgi:putative peptidoglycan lipid II flippase
VFISIIFFKEVGFLIIPIATTISSWFNAVLLFIFLKKKNLFNFNLVFIDRFIKILIASVLMGIFFNYLIYFFNDRFLYEASLKGIYLVCVVILGLIFYLLTAILIKAFKRSDINLNY